MRHRVFVTRQLPGPALSLLKQSCDVEVWTEEIPPTPETMNKKVAGIDGLLSLLTDRIDADVMDAAAPRLKVISNYAVGYDNIDIPAATSRGIPVGHTPGVLTEATADLAFALMMATARRLVEGAAISQNGKYLAWSPNLLLGQDVFGATLGIVGMGRIGKAMARRAAGFNMQIIYCDSEEESQGEIEGARKVTLDELLETSDFISIHTPLTKDTKHLFDARTLAKMKPDAILINTARGPIIDHDALYDALKSRKIGAAALDVTSPEPLSSEHRLFSLDNCLIVPHLGSASVAARSKMADIAVDNLLCGLAGKRLPHCVNKEVWDD